MASIESKISIRLKILLLLSSVVFLAVTLYLYLASKIFYEDKMLLIYELNQNNVRTLGAESEAGFNRILDKMRVLGALYSEEKATHTNLTQSSLGQTLLDATLGSQHPFVKIAIVEQQALTDGLSHWRETVQLGKWTDSLQVYLPTEAASTGSSTGSPNESPNESNDTYFSKLLQEIQEKFPIPYESVLKGEIWIKNVTLERDNAPPLLAIASVISRADSPVKSVIFALVKMDYFMGNFQKGGLAETALLDSEGFVLVKSESAAVYKRENLSADPLVQAASQVKVRSGVKQFEIDGQSYVGSFYRLGFRLGGSSLLLISRVKAVEAFAAATVLFKKSLLYALFVITAAFLIALFFSHSLTVPIQRLVEATHRIAQGDLGLAVPISTHDELAVLGASFNLMSSDLLTSRAKIEEYSRDLEKKVIERTLKLEEQNIAIKEAQEALVRTTRLASVGEVAGRAAHEVLNPLTNISTRLEKMYHYKSDHENQNLAVFLEIIQAWKKDFREKGPEGFARALSVPSTVQPEKMLIQEDLENLEAITGEIRGKKEEERTNVEFLLKETGRIAKIINGMRQLTRVSSSRRVFEVHSFLTDAMSTMSDILQKNGVQIENRFCSDSLKIIGDHDELLQVLSNLIRNSMQAIVDARKTGRAFGKPEKILISTEKKSTEQKNIRVLIRVSDNGPGIAPELFDTIFESSFTTKTSEEGTGLGLSICRRFVRAHQGEITVEKSEPAQETTFLIDLPAAPEKEPKEEPKKDNETG